MSYLHSVTDLRYKYCRKPSDDWRHETQCHGYLLLLITSYIHYIYIYIIDLSLIRFISREFVIMVFYLEACLSYLVLYLTVFCLSSRSGQDLSNLAIT